MIISNSFKCILFLLFIFVVEIFSLRDPYDILEINRKATLPEIRIAYKKLVRQWHPDKSDHPDAENKFVEIKQAYELLSDPVRRSAYDKKGITNEEFNNFHQPRYYSKFRYFSSDPFDQFFGQNMHFNQDINLFHKLSITKRYYQNYVKPKSALSPYILFFYGSLCFPCFKAIDGFRKLIDTLEPLGITFSTIKAETEFNLLREIGVPSLPCLAMVLNGQTYIYKDSLNSTQKVVEFIRRKMPYKLIQKINDHKIDNFLNGWLDNRVRVLIMEPRKQIRLRYLLAAYQFRERVTFGFVELNTKESVEIQDRFKVHPNLDTILIFNEDITRPVASVSMAEIPVQTLNNIIASNKYLALPRLSSQEVLENICPAEWNSYRKKLCVVLITENNEKHNPARNLLRNIALKSGYNTDRVRFAYIFQDKQTDFVNALSEGASDDLLLRLVVIWRRDTSRVKYEWVNDAKLVFSQNENEQQFNKTKAKIDMTVQRLLKSSEALSYEAIVKDLLNEHAQGLIANIFNKMLYIVDYLNDNIGQEQVFQALSLLATIALILLIGYFMIYLVREEVESVEKRKSSTNNTEEIKKGHYVPELRLHELRAEKYNGLVRLLKPGCRTIVLVTDLQSRHKLIPRFHNAVWPYRKNKTLMFAHMLIEKGLNWYSEILRLSLSESRDLKINPRNCIGTVLALNGHRKYFCMYHAKHPETNKGANRMLKMTRQLTTMLDDPEAGAFLGMDNSSNDSENECEPKILLEENLLNGLSNWLDRLFEGSTHRYYINYWPDFTTK